MTWRSRYVRAAKRKADTLCVVQDRVFNTRAMLNAYAGYMCVCVYTCIHGARTVRGARPRLQHQVDVQRVLTPGFWSTRMLDMCVCVCVCVCIYIHIYIYIYIYIVG